jgi:rhodanese-related sulfurtransferase
MSFLKKLFGIGPSVDYTKLMSEGAVIVDVRTSSEYRSGHIKGSVNIPLDNLKSGISKLKKEKPVITCCASGMRSSAAKNILSNNGFTQVYNGGGWMSLQRKIS